MCVYVYTYTAICENSKIIIFHTLIVIGFAFWWQFEISPKYISILLYEN
jgi:hypothetical protein